jgi:hypothetical protein
MKIIQPAIPAVTIVLLLMLMLSCSGGNDISPPLAVLQRDEHRMVVSVSAALLTRGQYRALEQSRNPVIPYLDDSTALFTPFGSSELSPEAQTTALSIAYPDERDSTLDYLQRWEPERKERFIAGLAAVPGMDARGMREAVVDSRPFFAADFMMNQVFKAAAGFDRSWSAERIYVERAQNRRIPILPLESYTDWLEARDAAEQEPFLEYLEMLVGFSADEQALEIAFQTLSERLYAAVTGGSPGDPGEDFLRDLGADDGDIASFRAYRRSVAELNFREREERWVRAIENYFRQEDEARQITVIVDERNLLDPQAGFIDLLIRSGWQRVPQE